MSKNIYVFSPILDNANLIWYHLFVSSLFFLFIEKKKEKEKKDLFLVFSLPIGLALFFSKTRKWAFPIPRLLHGVYSPRQKQKNINFVFVLIPYTRNNQDSSCFWWHNSFLSSVFKCLILFQLLWAWYFGSFMVT